jgi:hypothetical protein
MAPMWVWVPPEPGLPSTTSHARRFHGAAFFVAVGWVVTGLSGPLSGPHRGTCNIQPSATLTSRRHSSSNYREAPSGAGI